MLWLTADEVEELTGRKRWKVQARVLGDMGVPFTLNGAGRPLVLRSQFEAQQKPPRRRTTAPTWDAA